MIKQIPNIITLSSLFLGCIAATYLFDSRLLIGFASGNDPNIAWKAMEQDFFIATLLILIAAVLDFLDGLFARLLNARSELGVQLDSLADLVSFGVVPGIIMYKLLILASADAVSAFELPMHMFYMAFLIPVFAAVRLGRFNLDKRELGYFIGLPVPAVAMFVISLPYIIHFNTFGLSPLLLNPYVLYALIIMLCYLMVSPLRMPNMKPKTMKLKGNEYRIAMVIIGLVSVLFLQMAGIAIIIFAYIFLSFFHHNQTKTPAT